MDVFEREAMARAIVDANSYLTLGTADAEGLPWASPVWYAPASYREFFWVSKPGARHSQNIAVRPEVGIVIPAHASALGKAILAFDDEAASRMLA